MTEFQLSPIENEGKRVLTTAQLAEAYGTTVGTVTRNFNRNKEHYTEGKHFYCLTGEELKAFFASDKLSVANFGKVRCLYLWTERGSLLHAKSLNTDKAWEAYDYLLEHYFQTRDIQTIPDYSALSPQLQFMIQMEQRQNALESKQAEQATALEITNAKLDGIKDVISLNPNSWRSDITAIIRKIANNSSSGFSGLNFVWDEFYSLVDTRSRVSLKTRLTNKRNRMYGEGVCRSAVNKVNRLDIIGEDRKLIEISLAIAKEMAVKYNVC
ncbi:MAG: ORF6N domain-containing protein [Ruminococcus sp.]|nr:ORF6N domain-containing protein [Ruminococcus sp.]